ncbi:hypothetical protein J6590_014068 [Homalodisca vitripennis]|nr:hypothetical protein J6590_014068 [Homalodisca vitripennis]
MTVFVNQCEKGLNYVKLSLQVLRSVWRFRNNSSGEDKTKVCCSHLRLMQGGLAYDPRLRGEKSERCSALATCPAPAICAGPGRVAEPLRPSSIIAHSHSADSLRDNVLTTHRLPVADSQWAGPGSLLTCLVAKIRTSVDVLGNSTDVAKLMTFLHLKRSLAPEIEEFCITVAVELQNSIHDSRFVLSRFTPQLILTKQPSSLFYQTTAVTLIRSNPKTSFFLLPDTSALPLALTRSALFLARIFPATLTHVFTRHILPHQIPRLKISSREDERKNLAQQGLPSLQQIKHREICRRDLKDDKA